MRQMLPTDVAAMYLGVTAETLRSWRRRGIGPAYVRYPGGYIRRRSGRENWDKKAGGTIVYSVDGLKAFVERMTVQAGRLPRPVPGRLPRGAEGAKRVTR